MEFRFDPRQQRFTLRPLLPAGEGARLFVADDRAQFGIEEEYFLADAETFEAPTETPDALFHAADFGATGHVGREFLQAQIEVATEPHCDIEQSAA